MFNTLRYAKMLEEVGFSREQAETSVKILIEIMEEKLVSKQDLQDLKIAFQKDFHDFKSDMQSSLAQLESKITLSESKLTIKMGTMLAASIAVLTAIQKLI